MRCQTLYESLPCICFSIDSAGLILSVSQFGAAYLGYRVEELIYKSSLSLIHPEDQEKQIDAIAKCIDSKLIVNCQNRVYSKENKTLWVKARTRLISDTHCHPAFLLVWEDITECYPIAQAEVALRESEYRYYTLAKVSPVGIFRTNAQGECIYVNDRWCELAGMSWEESFGEGWLEALHPDDRERVLREWNRMTQENLPYKVECRFQHPDQAITWVLAQAIAEKGENGEIKGYVGTITDITASKQAEEALRQSEATNRALLNAIPDLMLRLDKEGTYLDVRGAKDFEALMSMRSDLGKTVCEILPPTVAATTMHHIQQALETGKLQIFDYQLSWMCKLYHYEARIVACQDNEVLILLRDITASKQAEKALQESREKYRLLFQIFPIGISITDEVGKLIEVNPASEKILGISAEEQLYQKSEKRQIIRSDGTLMPPDEYPSVRAFKDNCLIENIEMGIVTDNKISWISVTAAPIPLQGYGVAIAYIDITQHKQTDETLQQQFLRERLMRAIQARIHQSLDLTKVLNTTVAEVRQFLQTDRVIIYRFESNWSGVVIVESVALGWTPMLGRTLQDDCFAKELYIEPYRQGRIQAIEDIYTTELTPCYVNLLAQFDVKANLVVPLLQGKKLWGLLVAQHCTQPRQWQLWEIELLKQLATQVGIAIQQAELFQKLEVANQALKRLATLDGLTGLANRRRFDEYIEQEWRRLAREQKPMSLILCDIDFFKLYNDTYGHQAGDDCLKKVATAISESVKRPADLAARYGGEEFVVILPHTTAAGAFCLAQSIHQQIRQLKLAHPRSTISQFVTLSLGVAGLIPCPGITPATLIARADTALYEAKTTGRDRVVFANSD